MATPRKLTRTDGKGPSAKVSLTDEGMRVLAELAAEGQDQRSIANRLGVSYSTFKNIVKRDEAVQEAFAAGKGLLADEITHILLTAARKGQYGAAIFLAKARLGWSETPTEVVRPNIVINLPDALPVEAYMKAVANNALPHMAPLQPKGIALPAPAKPHNPDDDLLEEPK